jgi:hypothetical protein
MLKKALLFATAACVVSAAAVHANKKATDTTPAEDLKVCRDYFTERFPGVALQEFANGVYSIDEASKKPS